MTRNYDYEVRKVTLDDVYKVYELMLEVTKDGLSPYYSSSGIEYYESRIQEYGFIFGAFIGDKLIAYAILDFVGVGEDNYGHLVGIPKNELLRVALAAGCVVAAEHRGNGLQRQLCEIRERCAAEFGCLHVFASVHPDNHYSGNNLLAAGFKVAVDRKELSWGVRDILYKVIS